ncbi:MAG: hypothetical protein JNL13_04635 [Chitinophagaceae bacterium]|nr:hypothetical protein [Chitinophagaceae bacterium]
MKIRILSLLTLLCILFHSAASAQFVTPNVVKRNACLPGLTGCATVKVALELSASGFASYGFVTTHDINHPELAGKSYSTLYTKIKVTISGRSTSGAYFLPTTIGDQVIIPATDNLTFGGNSYNVFIKKTGYNEFYLSVSNSNL